MKQSLLSAKWNQVLSDGSESKPIAGSLARSLCDDLLAAGSGKLNKLEAMREVIATLRAAPTQATRWYADGMEAYLTDEGSNLEAKLGLKPPRGGRMKTVWCLQRKAELQNRLSSIASAIPGDSKTQIRTLGKCIRAIHRNGKIEEPIIFAELKKLIADFRIPASEWRITRLVETVRTGDR